MEPPQVLLRRLRWLSFPISQLYDNPESYLQDHS